MKIIDQKGFTLIELLVTMAVFAVLAGMAAPAFSSMMKNQDLNKSARELAFAFTEARAKAAMERRNVQVVLGTLSTDTMANNNNNQLNWKPVGKSTLKSGSPVTITFLPTGLTSIGTDSTFEICTEGTGSSSKKIVISRLGNIQPIPGGTC